MKSFIGLLLLPVVVVVGCNGANDRGYTLEEVDAIGIEAPDDYGFWLKLATRRFAGNDLNGTIDALNRAIELAPNSASNYYLLIECYDRLHMKAEADAAIKRAIEVAKRHDRSELDELLRYQERRLERDGLRSPT